MQARSINYLTKIHLQFKIFEKTIKFENIDVTNNIIDFKHFLFDPIKYQMRSQGYRKLGQINYQTQHKDVILVAKVRIDTQPYQSKNQAIYLFAFPQKNSE